MIDRLTVRDFADRVHVDRSSFSVANGLVAVVVDGREGSTTSRRSGARYPDRTEIADLPVVIIGIGTSPEEFDLVVDAEEELGEVLEAIGRRPLASVATALLLRPADARTVTDGLVAESTTYSMLQSGPEFREWCSQHPRSGGIRKDSASPILVDRLESPSGSGDHLVITLHRPERRNAYSAAMRAALADALDVALVDSRIDQVTLRGAGSNFSSGGDLDEFGSFTDPVTAHVARLTSHVAASLWRLRR
ncbi:MAG: enoyl-CoA hydratase-related protein, partial [Actinomycetota bacterium]